MSPVSTTPIAPFLAGLLLAALPALARAERSQMPAQVPKAYAQECASCHVAYPPGFLPAQSWQRMMGRLNKHYGVDASLDPATTQQLTQWLAAHAGTYKRVSEEPPEDRITQSAWWVRKHRKIDTPVWKLASVKSAANCAACHRDAEQGVFSDHHLRMPDGLNAQQKRAFQDD